MLGTQGEWLRVTWSFTGIRHLHFPILFVWVWFIHLLEHSLWTRHPDSMRWTAAFHGCGSLENPSAFGGISKQKLPTWSWHGVEVFEKTIWNIFFKMIDKFWLNMLNGRPLPHEICMLWFWFPNCLRLPKLQERCELMGFRPQGNPKDPIWTVHESCPVILNCLINGHEQNVLSTTCLGGRTFWMGSSSWRCTAPERFLQCANHSYQTCWYTCQCLLFFFPALGALVTKQNSPRQWQEKDLPCLPARPCSILLQYSDLHHLDHKLFICVIFLARSGSSR